MLIHKKSCIIIVLNLINGAIIVVFMCAKRKRIKLAKTIQSTFPKHEKVEIVIL